MTKWFDFFQLFSPVLRRFCPWHSENHFVLVLAHLEPELELFEVLKFKKKERTLNGHFSRPAATDPYVFLTDALPLFW